VLGEVVQGLPVSHPILEHLPLPVALELLEDLVGGLATSGRPYFWAE
jgi:hypothetical protein